MHITILSPMVFLFAYICKFHTEPLAKDKVAKPTKL